VPATEHSVMCMGGPEGEVETIKRLLTEVYPKGIVSVVSDTWDFWKVLTDILPQLREVVLSREGKLVVRPDSGDPVKIICGDPEAPVNSPARAGAMRILYSVFGGTTNAAGYTELDPHIGLIYGDSITMERQEAILLRLYATGFVSTNVVLGIGSFTYQHNTRDTFGQAIKATFGATRSGGGRAIFKDPKTDDGTKKSAMGLLYVGEKNGEIYCEKNVTWEREAQGLLRPIFHNGAARNKETLSVIRARLAADRAKDLQ
jgi:nicotinamide phosphoribosyltransferase